MTLFPKLGLSLLLQKRNADRVLGEGEKDPLYPFSRQRESQQANALKTVPPLEGIRR